MLFDIRHDADKQERRKGNIQQESHGRTHFRAAPFQLYTRFEVSDAGQVSAAQLRLAATHLYPLRRISIIPGIFEIHTSGRPHQISRASAPAASAPPNRLPSLRRNCISRINSSRDNPSSEPTRGSCSGASAIPRRSRIGASHRATRVQNLHSASENSHPRACRPFPSVYSLTREIMVSYPAALVLLQPCNSRKLVLTFERATASVSEISSAGSGCGERNSSACTCATVRLIPQRVPISPQCKMNFWATGVNEFFVGWLIFDLSFGAFA